MADRKFIVTVRDEEDVTPDVDASGVQQAMIDLLEQQGFSASDIDVEQVEYAKVEQGGKLRSYRVLDAA